VDDAADAMGLLQHLISGAFPGGHWLSTPSTTGRDLWRRTIPEGREWPVLSPELRELIQSTSGQGRMELLPAPADRGVPAGRAVRVEDFTTEAPGFVYLDGRFMYAGLTWGMPVGAPTWHSAQHVKAGEVAASLLMGRGRWLARVTVPADWCHVGIVPAMAEGGGWEYPREPGRTFTTWADASELSLAQRNGWRVELSEGFTFAEGKPLDTWTKKLVTMREAAAEAEAPDWTPAVRGLVRGAVRSILLYAVGAFASRQHLVTRYGDTYTGNPALTVGGVREVEVGGERKVMWQEAAGHGGWAESMAHPEWSAQIWARARVRLLDAPGIAPAVDGTHGLATRVGALHVPYEDVIAFRTDALYLTHDPRWQDDGRVGRFRVKGALGPVSWPSSYAELFRLRDQAEGAHNAL
jgi:hypothetical protein